MYSLLGVLLEEWCRIDGNDVITLVGVVRNGISVGTVGGRPGLNLGMVFTTFLLRPRLEFIYIVLYCYSNLQKATHPI